MQGQAVVTVVSGDALGHEAWRKKELAHWLQVKGLVREGRAPPWSSVWCTRTESKEGLREDVCLQGPGRGAEGESGDFPPNPISGPHGSGSATKTLTTVTRRAQN